MKQTTILQCSYCEQDFDKPLKEYNRWIRKGRTNFYCSRSCAGKALMGDRFEAWVRSDANRKHLNTYRIGDDEYSSYRPYLRNARTRIHDCTVTLEELKNLWKQQEGRCVYTNVKLVHGGYTKKKNSNPNFTASLDRIDSTRGYHIDNVQFVSQTVNWAKNQQSDQAMREFIHLVLENSKNKKEIDSLASL